jgi:hypothetical protein
LWRSRHACESSVLVLPRVRKPQIVRSSSSLGEHARRVGGQRAHERELLLGELDRRPAQAHDARRRVNLELAHPQAPRAPAHVGPAQQRLEPSARSSG